ncbi:phosphatase PAP2 family protein [Leuconostoc mesenteroides]|uniref:phosphatase PAP2 family protein n=1 Tax=Leuconostoc mesenteroides TaxID=1245 RepID=UPI0021A4FF58|nr:phosphatase PAP2 family protein [Leuconostoc mesenteroides]MCT3038838.1 phosphatase PAP2 family protein [Leuconostoc mesenteroides]
MTIQQKKQRLSTVLATILFGIMTFGVLMSPNWFRQFDIFFQQSIQHRGTFTTLFFTYITQAGNMTTIIVVSVIVSIFLAYKHCYRELLFLSVNIIFSAGIITQVLKHMITRVRPQPQLIQESGYSFPSGHSMAAILLYGSLIILINYHLKPSLFKTASVIVLTSLIIIIPISRVYVNVHYPSDILAGLSLGYVLLFISKYFIFDLKSATGVLHDSHK